MKCKIKIPYQATVDELPAFKHAYKNDAGYDLYSTENTWVPSGETRAIMTTAQVCIPAGYVGLVVGRSGNNARGMLCHLGTIDAGYTGTIYAVLSSVSYHGMHVRKGERIAQLVILKLPEVEMVEGDFPDTERGENGLGSTGR